MAMSINTNVAAMTALQNLTKTSMQLGVSENRISTGLKIAGAKDNAAYYAIAQTMRAEVAGLSASTDSMNRAKSTVDVALVALDSIQDIMVEMKNKAVAASDAGLDEENRASLVRDFNSLFLQARDIADSAGFNGTNLLAAAPDSLSAILNGDASKTLAVAGSSALTAMKFSKTLVPGTANADAADMQTQIGLVEDSIQAFAAIQSTFGNASRRLDTQLSFNVKLSDATEAGIGNLVDADIARESAKLQALQIKQQLGLQALSIANSRPQAILA
ncbi:MAG: flagellin, partial [Pacificimonas sp.]